VIQAASLSWADLYDTEDRARHRHAVAHYDYRDESGTLLYQVVRFEPKDFRPRRPDGNGGWTWNLNDVRRVPYRLPDLAGRDSVLVVEGEKDAEAAAALGFAATCNVGGAGKWRDDYTRQLVAAGVRRVWVVPDNDAPGRAHADSVVRSCRAAQIDARVVWLPDVPEKGDLSDYLKERGKDDLDALLAAPSSPFPGAAKDDNRMPSPSFNLTDAGNAEFFAETYGQRLRYDHARKRWLVFGGHRWQADSDAELMRLAKQAVRRRFTNSVHVDNLMERAAHAKWAIESESRARLESLLHLARAEHPIADDGEGWDADHLSLGALNGVIDLRTGQLRDGRPDDRVTMQTAVAFDPTARCPRWEQCIAEMFEFHPELVPFIHRAVGYSITGITTEQVLFLLHGTGANGKSTFIETLKHVLGDYALNTPFSTMESHRPGAATNDLAALVNRRFVTASEANDGAKLNEGVVKNLTGTDSVSARFLYSEWFTFKPTAKFWLAVNHKPVVRDDSHGFWRRIRLIPFDRRFAVNPSLGAELRAEAAGILAWAVQGCLLWQREGLQVPDVVTTATRSYEHESDPLHDFIAEGCEFVDGAEVQAAELYDHYKRWAERQGMGERERLNTTRFGRLMAERFERGKDRTGRRVYRGIARRATEGFSAKTEGSVDDFANSPNGSLTRGDFAKRPSNPPSPSGEADGHEWF
jgi:putative DNA primase/helicase